MIPQPASVRTISPRHTVKQGVKPVAGQAVKVTERFKFPDGTYKTEDELTSAERQKFCQKVLDAITPLLYDAVLEDIEQEAAG